MAPSSDLTVSTLRPTKPGDGGRRFLVPALTVLHHADRTRVGDVARLVDLLGGREVSLNRTEPLFAAPGPAEPRPLADPHLSRKGIRILPRDDGGLVLEVDGVGLEVNGVPLTGTRTFTPQELDAGAVLALGDRAVLLLHRLGPVAPPIQLLGLIGASEVVERLRSDLLHAADLEVTVLLRGESGTGKELAARALHQRGARRAGPFVAVSMAALAPSMAAAELFGHTAGAFTGATRARSGYFAEAHGGTLFLDEVAEMAPELQALLLRALETREVQPVGSARSLAVDVRVVAATDADLEEQMASGKFRQPLFHRLAGYQVHLPALRDRRDDFGRLLHHFLAEELATVGESARLERSLKEPLWLPAELVARLAAYDWPGNVRQLRNVVRQLVISSRGREVARIDAIVEKLLARPEPAAEIGPETARPRKASAAIGDDELVEALRRNRWRTSATAAELGISRTTLYAWIDRSTRIRKARDVPREELLRCLEECGGDLDAAAERLEVSKRGLQLLLAGQGD